MSTLSALLLDLRRAGLVSEDRRGKWVFYSLPGEVGSRVLLDVILMGVMEDPQVRKDAALAGKQRRTPAAAACAALKDKP